jgi:hypothetical protein
MPKYQIKVIATGTILASPEFVIADSAAQAERLYLRTAPFPLTPGTIRAVLPGEKTPAFEDDDTILASVADVLLSAAHNDISSSEAVQNIREILADAAVTS